jgi:UDP-glucose 4-epimerase
VGKHVFITGAKGFLGRYCAAFLASQGWIVTGIGYGNWSATSRKIWGVSTWRNSAVTLDSLRHLAGKAGLPDAIVHCAGGSSVARSYEDPRDDFERTVASTIDVLEFVRCDAPFAKIIYPSSAAVYGAVANVPIPESTPLIPVSPYGRNKLSAEEYCRLYASEWHLSVGIIRFFSLYGEGLRKQLLWDACQKGVAGKFNFFGDGSEIRDWLHVKDAARLIEFSLGMASDGAPVINGGTGKGTSVKEIVAYLGERLDVSTAPAFTRKAKAGDPARQIADVGRLAELGFSPSICWQEGIAFYAKWFLERGRQ